MTVVRSIGMIMFCSAVEYLKNEKGYRFYYNGSDSYWSYERAWSYAKHIGFFKSLGINKGKDYYKYYKDLNHKYCPIVRLSESTLLNKFRDTHVGIVKFSKYLSSILTEDIPQADLLVSYLIREIIRNTFEHTDSDHVWVSAQRHTYNNYIEVAIADNSVGIKHMITVNPKLRPIVHNDSEALQAAIKPGISTGSDNHSGVWENSGYGLYVTSELLKNLGKFRIVSGKSYLECNDNSERPYIGKANYHGTAVQLVIKISNVKNIIKNNESLLNKILKKGQNIAKHDKYASSNSASLASQLFNV